MGRLRLLWMHLRTSLPEAFLTPALARAKRLPDFFAQLLEATDEPLVLQHYPGRDAFFAGARGAAGTQLVESII